MSLGNQQSVSKWLRPSNPGNIYLTQPAWSQTGSEVALASLWLALSPACPSHLLSGQGSGEIEGSLFTGQAQIRFLTAPPELLCQGKLALQNRSLTGKCVSLFISHSHWKKRWGGGSGWSWCHSFHRTSQRHRVSRWLPGTACVSLHGTEQNWPEAQVSLPSPSTLPPSPTSFWGLYSLRVLQAALKRNLGATRSGKVFLAFLAEVTCIRGTSCLLVGREGRCWL